MPQRIDFGIPISNNNDYCFISYTRSDAPRIAGIIKALSTKGLPMWYDQALKYSRNWEAQIAEKIDNCRLVIAFISNQTLQKENSYSILECRMATDSYKKDVYYVLLDKIDLPKIRYEYSLWWTSISKTHLFQIETQTDNQIASSICKSILPNTYGRRTSAPSHSDAKSSSTVVPLFFIVLALYLLVHFGVLKLPFDDTDSQNQRSQTTVTTETSAVENPTITIAVEKTITIYGGIHAPVSDFLFPYSSTELISEEEMYAEFWSSDPMMMRFYSQAAINEIFARYGYTFTSNRDSGIAAREKFSQLSWYKEVQSICPSSEAEIIRIHYMNDIERKNIERINNWQNENNVPE